MRIWGGAPSIGSQLAEFSRKFFFSGSLIALACVSSYVWAQFPYDNLCDPTDDGQNGFSGVYTKLTDANGDPLEDSSGNLIPEITVTQDNNAVYCSQSWR
jgi:hypothetical protein